MSLFALLFGFGFALQWRGLKRRAAVSNSPAPAVATRAYRRRLWFLLGVGVAHGTLLYYGDILTAYAVTGFVVLAYADVRAAALVRATRLWWIVALLWSGAWMAIGDLAPPVDGIDPAQIPEQNLDSFVVYSEAGYAAQIEARVGDYFVVLASTLFASLPQLVALFLLGALAARLGWLRRPQRHPQLWRRAAAIGLAALPFAAWGAYVNFRSLSDTPSAPLYFGYTLQTIGSIVVVLYVALAVRGAQTSIGRRLLRWCAPVGRMPLTNYLLQSLLMGMLLSGWGLGLGTVLTRPQLALLALLIVLLQWSLSGLWIARFAQGPVEALWRRATYRRPAKA